MLSGVGIILGAGIYALIGEAAGRAGNAVWLSFAISALVALFTALSYMELASMMPRAGAEYDYTEAAIGRRIAIVVGWLIVFTGILGAATVALGFGGYLAGMIHIQPYYAAALLILAATGLLLLGAKESAVVAVIFTFVEIAGLILIILAGLPFLGSADYLEMPSGISGVLSAAALIFFAYQGFEEMAKFSEEAVEPERTVPRAVIAAVAVTTLLYMLVSISAVSVLGWNDLSATSAPFALVATVAWGEGASIVLSFIALFATANTVLMMMFASSRITYGMARAGSLPAILSEVHAGKKTPWIAILFVAGGALLFANLPDIAFVANASNFTILVTFVLVNLSVVVLRWKRQGKRPFTIPFSLGRFPVPPLIGICTCLLLLVYLEPEVWGIGMVLLGIGAVSSLMLGKRER